MKTRNATIDIMRGITIFLVIVGHLVPYASYSFNLIYSFHMPIFFLLSGFCSAKSMLQAERLHFGKFLWKKIKSIYIPMLILRIILNLMLKSTAVMFSNPLYFIYNPGDWFLQTLFWGDMLFFLFVVLCRRFSHASVRVLLPAIWIVISTYLLDLSRTLMAKVGVFLPFHFGILALCFSFMLIGYLISIAAPYLESFLSVKKDALEQKGKIGVSIVGAVILLCFTVIGLIYLSENEIVNVATTFVGNNYFMFFGVCLLLIYFVYAMSKWLSSVPGIGRFLEFWGRNSLYVYIVHVIIHFGMNFILERITGTLFTPMIDLPWHFCLLYFVVDFVVIIPYILLHNKIKAKIKALRHRSPKMAGEGSV